jgi:hypothetical protein
MTINVNAPFAYVYEHRYAPRQLGFEPISVKDYHRGWTHRPLYLMESAAQPPPITEAMLEAVADELNPLPSEERADYRLRARRILEVAFSVAAGFVTTGTAVGI